MGSPPHTRGIPSFLITRSQCHGFTPAYAGNTAFCVRGGVGQWVHPRIRGEYFSEILKKNIIRGSPPHTRGIPALLQPGYKRLRFTPAYAGNTLYRRLYTGPSKVHPRIRGEYFVAPSVTLTVVGSPPHTRGILRRAPAAVGLDGFTPAYAGNTAIREYPRLTPQVHPRIRGEYLPEQEHRRPFWGSPPHTRGIPSKIFGVFS